MLHIFVWYKATYNLFSTFVSSDARNMARDVHNIVLKVVQEKGGMTESEALAYVRKMEAQKRYSADVWSWTLQGVVYSKKSLSHQEKSKFGCYLQKREVEIKLQLLNFNNIVIILCNAFSPPS